MIEQISKEINAIYFKEFGSTVYLLKLQDNNILIDTSSKENKNELIQELNNLNLGPEDITTIILTHAHYDHVDNIYIFPNAKIYGNFTKRINTDHSQTEIKTILPITDCPLVKRYQARTDSAEPESNSGKATHLRTDLELQVLNLPGHTPGDIAILYKNILFSGDIIFHNGYIGRNDFPESNPKEQEQSLKKISKIKYDILCPGHGQ